MAAGRRIAWSSTDRYSPVQDRVGVVDPRPRRAAPGASAGCASTPRPTSRPGWTSGRSSGSPTRVTTGANCAAPAATPASGWTGPDRRRPHRQRAPGCASRGTTSPVTCTDSVPDCRTSTCSARSRRWTRGLRGKLRWAAEAGLSTMSITNGAVSARPVRPDLRTRAGRRRPLQGDRQPGLDRPRGERRAAGQPGRVPPDDRHHPAGGRRRRAGQGADHCLAPQLSHRSGNGAALWEMGVRGFAFHCGSVEGVRISWTSGPGPSGPAGLAHAV